MNEPAGGEQGFVCAWAKVPLRSRLPPESKMAEGSAELSLIVKHLYEPEQVVTLVHWQPVEEKDVSHVPPPPLPQFELTLHSAEQNDVLQMQVP